MSREEWELYGTTCLRRYPFVVLDDPTLSAHLISAIPQLVEPTVLALRAPMSQTPQDRGGVAALLEILFSSRSKNSKSDELERMIPQVIFPDVAGQKSVQALYTPPMAMPEGQ